MFAPLCLLVCFFNPTDMVYYVTIWVVNTYTHHDHPPKGNSHDTNIFSPLCWLLEVRLQASTLRSSLWVAACVCLCVCVCGACWIR